MSEIHLGNECLHRSVDLTLADLLKLSMPMVALNLKKIDSGVEWNSLDY